MFDATSLIHEGGLLLLWLVVFAQTGLFFCFFLPGGGLMFAAGVLLATGGMPYNTGIVCALLVFANVLGNLAGYWFGRKTGPLLQQKKDTRFFKQQHLQTATRFYEKYGSIALAAGVPLPIIRTFGPIVAGMIQMPLPRFLTFTAIGSVLYVLGFLMSGYLIGSVPGLKPYLPYLIAGIVLIVTLPVVIKILRELRKPGT